ncbi:hypothetical protein HanPSC8_Chr05g0208301 [Helianthus annuus]|nr:hypothetical protein HanPSC8_Chr05g0208301 [Helianthus annuus]
MMIIIIIIISLLRPKSTTLIVFPCGQYLCFYDPAGHLYFGFTMPFLSTMVVSSEMTYVTNFLGSFISMCAIRRFYGSRENHLYEYAHKIS